MKAQFSIPGKPVGKGRPRFAVRGKFVQAYTPETTASFENLVKLCWQQSGCEKLEGEITAVICAYFPIPKSTSKKKRAEMAVKHTGCTTKPDADNIAKIVLDALNKMAYDDDSQVTRLLVKKGYSDEPRTVVVLSSGADRRRE